MLKKILFCNEASYMATGYSNYGREILTRLYANGKYEIAEMATYWHYTDLRGQQMPWRVYSNAPNPQNQEEVSQFYGGFANQFGGLRFDEVCLDFKPDVVISWLDPWMFAHIAESPLRHLFSLVIMPTVDSAPQQQGWLAMFNEADKIFTWSDWGAEILEKAGLQTLGANPAGVDLDVFKPVDSKEQHKAAFGIQPNVNIVGMVARNQKRKLFPDLFDAFRLFLDQNPELGKNTLLYLHTSFPDPSGWRLDQLLKEKSLSHKVLFTYICRKCGFTHPSFFADARTRCLSCGALEFGFVNTQIAVPPNILAAIYNLMDVYVQYAMAAGLEIPALEAGACGIPVMETDYSAMESVVRHLEGTPLKVQRLFLEAETEAYRAYPDNQYLADKLAEMLSKPASIRANYGFKARQGVEKHYTWDKAAKKWEECFDSLPHGTWTSPPRLFQPQLQVPRDLTHEQFVSWALIYILGKPELINTYFALKLIKDLNWGSKIDGLGGYIFSDESALGQQARTQPFNWEICANRLLEMREKINYWEKRRIGAITAQKPDYIVNVKPDINLN